MKEFFKNIIVIFLFVIVFVGISRLVAPKYVDTLIEGSLTRDYYESPKDHELIVLGDCEVYSAVNPNVLFENHGIKAFNRANAQQTILQSYYLLKETLNYETPKYVMLSVGALRTKEKNEAYNRLLLDDMKWSKEKVELIKATRTDGETYLSYVFKLLRYHSRIVQLTKEDIVRLPFNNGMVTHSGFIINKNVVPLENLPTKRVLNDYSFDETNIEYLDKIVKLCEDNNIKLILFKSISEYPYWYTQYDDYLTIYAQKNNLDYYNFNKDIKKIGINYNTDTYDGGMHLNLDGANKFSKYLGDVLTSKYEFTNGKGDPVYHDLMIRYKYAI